MAAEHINVGIALLAVGQYDAAIGSLFNARVVTLRVSPHDSDTLALVSYNLGSVLCRQGRFEEGLDALESCLAMWRKLLPPDHPKLAKTLLMISMANNELGRIPTCLESLVESSAVARRSQIACAAEGCTRKMKADGAALDVCVNCRRTFYCGKACQTADWKAGHKAECKALAAESEESAPGEL